jgi:5,10-methenyltetrahydrofolate synthetase
LDGDAVTGDEHDIGGSPPCLLHELSTDGSLPVDARQASDVARWRRAERARLLTARSELAPAVRAKLSTAIALELGRLIPADARTVSVYWPIRAEPDLREWMRARAAAGLGVALPVALAHGQPLIFRAWHPGARMAHGLWRIPYPPDGAAVQPDVAIAPLVGFDAAGFRLGYGGGFFDRTLASLRPRPLVIGVGYPGAAIQTIYPQPHDIGMDWIVTGAAPARRFPR